MSGDVEKIAASDGLTEGERLRITAFVTQGLGLGCDDQRPRARAAKLIRKAAAILDRIDLRNHLITHSGETM